MLQLFKAKSLKKTQETEQGANGMSAQGAGAQSADNKNAKKQKGRSMVEMLGVLAIIGVLSIGGIQGYTLAMRKYKANEIINIVNKYAMVLYSNCLQAMERDPEHYGIIKDSPALPDGVEPDHWTYLWQCPYPIFKDVGLGPLPSGVKSIGSASNRPDDERTTIVSLSSGDAVVITVAFETKELCEATMGITGKPVIQGWGTEGMIGSDTTGVDYTCGKFRSNYYPLAIVSMMN